MGVATAEQSGQAGPVMAGDVPWHMLLRAWQELDIPDGWRAEICGEGIVVVPPPSNEHGRIINKVDRALLGIAPEGVDAFQNIGVQIPALARLYVPDLVFAAESDLPAGSHPVSADAVLMAVETTSRSNAWEDRNTKRLAYAAGGIPLYLLIDAWDPSGPTIALFSDPRGGDYDNAHRVPFGKPVSVPHPFGTEIETADFPLPPGAAGSGR